MFSKQISNLIVRFIGNTFIGTILLIYFLFSSSIIFLTSVGAKTICDRLEPNYVICEQEELRFDRLIRQEKTSFRLIDVVIKNKITGSVHKIRDSKERYGTLEKKYNLYLKTENGLILYNYYSYLSDAQSTAEVILNYIKEQPNPKSYLLNIRNNVLKIYPQSKYFYINIFISILGWLILIIIVQPIFRQINKFTVTQEHDSSIQAK
ncbi:hypothetical protein [Pleurocapsa sp. PCC 7319]|uniref:hypothetical protein n=1 Tax=Pleurocapsa sp. PCC 7319 TaxID=118161 RepID=UPI00034D2613|nr:hypothetical protein [Pleurocapsa sp. PCC 7319]